MTRIARNSPAPFGGIRQDKTRQNRPPPTKTYTSWNDTSSNKTFIWGKKTIQSYHKWDETRRNVLINSFMSQWSGRGEEWCESIILLILSWNNNRPFCFYRLWGDGNGPNHFCDECCVRRSSLLSLLSWDNKNGMIYLYHNGHRTKMVRFLYHNGHGTWRVIYLYHNGSRTRMVRFIYTAKDTDTKELINILFIPQRPMEQKWANSFLPQLPCEKTGSFQSQPSKRKNGLIRQLLSANKNELVHFCHNGHGTRMGQIILSTLSYKKNGPTRSSTTVVGQKMALFFLLLSQWP